MAAAVIPAVVGGLGAAAAGASAGGIALGAMGGALSGIMGEQARNEQQRALRQAAGQIYVPRYLGTIDPAVASWIMTSAEFVPDYERYEPYINQMLATSTLPQTYYMPYLQSYLQSALQPDSGLYQYYLDKLIDATRSGLSARNLATSPYGALLENEAITNFTNQWLTDSWNRQSQALQNYLAGLSGINQLGQGALQTALQLENLSYNRYQPLIQSGLNYMGYGSAPQQALANLYAQQIPTAGNQWAQLANTFGNVFSNWLAGRTLAPATAPVQGGLSPAYSQYIPVLGANW